MKRFISILVCVFLLVGCAVNKDTVTDKAKREIELYNSNVAKIMNNYDLNYTKASSIETELVTFLITLKPNKELGEAVPIFKDRKSFVDFIGIDYSTSNYSMNIYKEDSEDFADYIKGYTVKDSEVEYYMNSTNGNLYMYITYYNTDTRVLSFEIVWKDGEVISFISSERGESINEEAFESFRR